MSVGQTCVGRRNELRSQICPHYPSSFYSLAPRKTEGGSCEQDTARGRGLIASSVIAPVTFHALLKNPACLSSIPGQKSTPEHGLGGPACKTSTHLSTYPVSPTPFFTLKPQPFSVSRAPCFSLQALNCTLYTSGHRWDITSSGKPSLITKLTYLAFPVPKLPIPLPPWWLSPSVTGLFPLDWERLE